VGYKHGANAVSDLSAITWGGWGSCAEEDEVRYNDGDRGREYQPEGPRTAEVETVCLDDACPISA
jgi:hypothetical protein